MRLFRSLLVSIISLSILSTSFKFIPNVVRIQMDTITSVSRSRALLSKSDDDGTERERLEDIYERIKSDNKRTPSSSYAAFLTTACIGVPLGLGLVLPMSLLYQTIKSFGKINASRGVAMVKVDEEQESLSIDDVSSQSDIIRVPFQSRKFDIGANSTKISE